VNQDVAAILRSYKVIAVVGLSSSQDRPSYGVAWYLQQQGYRIIPVNPNETEVFGERAYPDLLSVPEPVEIVQIFRRSEYVAEVVDQAIAIGAKAIWMQDGIADEAAAQRARDAGLLVVMNDCMAREYRRLMIQGPRQT
jgi:predicted CoA-binding protein